MVFDPVSCRDGGNSVKFIFGQDEILTRWLIDKVPHMEGMPEKARAIGITDSDGRLIAVGVYYNWSERFKSIEFAGASITPKWMSREVLSVLFKYPFVQLGCERLTLVIPRRNRRARRVIEGLGFVLEGKARKGFLDDDAMIYGILREEAERWMMLERKAA